MCILKGDEVPLGDDLFARFEGFTIYLHSERPSREGLVDAGPEIWEKLGQMTERVRKAWAQKCCWGTSEPCRREMLGECQLCKGDLQ